MDEATPLVENPFSLWEDRLEERIPTATLQIYKYIADSLNRPKDININRASSATMCVRRRWYQANGYEATPLTPRKIVNFMLGDLTERTLLYFIKEALIGPGLLYKEVLLGEELGEITFQGKDITLYKQQDLSFKLTDGTVITGHADGFGKRNSDDQWELIEIKSAASYGFDEFKRNGPGDYLKQAHALMLMDQSMELDVKSVRFYYLAKETGHLYDRIFNFDPKIAHQVIKEFKLANNSEAPEAPYALVPELLRGKPTGKTTCPWQCGYCSYLHHCKPGFTKEFKSGRPKFYWEGKNNKQKESAYETCFDKT